MFLKRENITGQMLETGQKFSHDGGNAMFWWNDYGCNWFFCYDPAYLNNSYGRM